MFYDIFDCLHKNIKNLSPTVEYKVLFEQCSVVIFTDDTTMNLAEWVWSKIHMAVTVFSMGAEQLNTNQSTQGK